MKRPLPPRFPIWVLVTLLAFQFASCDLIDPPPTGMVPEPDALTPAALPQPSEASRALSAYYKSVQSDLLSQGLLRSDRGGRGAPFGARELSENFIRIALYDEYSLAGDQLVARPRESRLRKWEDPIVFSVEFGESVPHSQRRRDLTHVRAYVSRLSTITGLAMSVGGANPNFHVLFLNEDERLAYGPRLRLLEPGIRPPSIRTIVNMPRSTFCLVNAFSGPTASAAISTAIAVIRAEHPDRLRLSCIHEELAQGLGLANDSPSARPSIFNDDEEFGLLTTHDELLLRILYAPELRLGMSIEQARPIANEIAAHLMGGA